MENSQNKAILFPTLPNTSISLFSKGTHPTQGTFPRKNDILLTYVKQQGKITSEFLNLEYQVIKLRGE